MAPNGFDNPFVSPLLGWGYILQQPLEYICFQKFTFTGFLLIFLFPFPQNSIFSSSFFREVGLWSFLCLFTVSVRLLKYLLDTFMYKTPIRRATGIHVHLGLQFGSSSCLVNQFLLIWSWWAWVSMFLQEVNGILLIWVEPCQIYKLTSNQRSPTQWNISGRITSLSTQTN